MPSTGVEALSTHSATPLMASFAYVGRAREAFLSERTRSETGAPCPAVSHPHIPPAHVATAELGAQRREYGSQSSEALACAPRCGAHSKPKIPDTRIPSEAPR